MAGYQEPEADALIFGQMGLLKLVYQGDVNGRWKGPETCHLYEFGRERRVQYVDRRDIPKMLLAKGPSGEQLFRPG